MLSIKFQKTWAKNPLERSIRKDLYPIQAFKHQSVKQKMTSIVHKIWVRFWHSFEMILIFKTTTKIGKEGQVHRTSKNSRTHRHTSHTVIASALVAVICFRTLFKRVYVCVCLIFLNCCICLLCVWALLMPAVILTVCKWTTIGVLLVSFDVIMILLFR